MKPSKIVADLDVEALADAYIFAAHAVDACTNEDALSAKMSAFNLAEDAILHQVSKRMFSAPCPSPKVVACRNYAKMAKHFYTRGNNLAGLNLAHAELMRTEKKPAIFANKLKEVRHER